DPAEVWPAEGFGAAEIACREDIFRATRLEMPLHELARDGGRAHFREHVERIGVGAERHGDAGVAVAVEALERQPAPGKRKWRVSNRHPVLGQYLQVVGDRIADLAMVGEVDAVREKPVPAQDAFIGKELHRRAAGLRYGTEELTILFEEMLRQADP